MTAICAVCGEAVVFTKHTWWHGATRPYKDSPVVAPHAADPVRPSRAAADSPRQPRPAEPTESETRALWGDK